MTFALAAALHLLTSLTTAIIAADVARCESGWRFDDGAVVLQVASNRAREWRRSLLSVLTQRAQFARACPAFPRAWSMRHLALGIEAAAGTLRAPAWAGRVKFYCGPSDRPAFCQDLRLRPAGRVVHTFYEASR